MAVEPAAPESGVGNALGQMSDAVKRVFFGKGSDSLQVEGQGRSAGVSGALL